MISEKNKIIAKKVITILSVIIIVILLILILKFGQLFVSNLAYQANNYMSANDINSSNPITLADGTIVLQKHALDSSEIVIFGYFFAALFVLLLVLNLVPYFFK